MFRKQPSSGNEMERLLRDGRLELPPLTIRPVGRQPPRDAGVDAIVSVSWGREASRFAVETKAGSTPKIFQAAVDRIRNVTLPPGTERMVVVPYLSESQLDELERDGLSGIDLCGNGVVIVPGRLFVRRTGAANRFTSSAPIKNIYKKNSAMVPRVFLARPRFDTVSAVLAEVNALNPLVSAYGRPPITIGTVSKALAALDEDLIIGRQGGASRLLQPDKLLEKLLESYPAEAAEVTRTRVSVELADLPARLAKIGRKLELPVMATGLSSATRYAVMQRGEVLSVYCSDPRTLLAELPLASSDRFPNLEVRPPSVDAVFFAGRADKRTGFLWASPAQAFLELMRGDKRDQDTAREVKAGMLNEIGVGT
jgi:hypothetical protein